MSPSTKHRAASAVVRDARRAVEGGGARSLLSAAAPRVRSWWAAHRTIVLKVLVVALALDASVMLLYESWRLLLQHAPTGAVDLTSRVRETHAWFAGAPVYGRFITAVYPPATYPILWPFTGWLPLGAVRVLWWLATAGSLAWLGWIAVRASGVREPIERAAIVLAILAMYATGLTIGDGQLLLVVLPLLLAGLLLLRRPERSVLVDLLVVVLLLVSLVKPQGAAPLLVIALMVTRRWIPLALVAAAYLALTLFAAAYQTASLPSLINAWLKSSSNLAGYHSTVFYANVHSWLSGLGLKGAILPASAVILLAFAYWTWRHRSVDPWLLIGVGGYVSRFWTYHMPYDDILILLPMIALLRIARGGPSADHRDVVAGALLAVTLALAVIPGGVYLFPGPLKSVFTALVTVVWLAGLVFLLFVARRPEPAPGPERPAAAAQPAG